MSDQISSNVMREYDTKLFSQKEIDFMEMIHEKVNIFASELNCQAQADTSIVIKIVGSNNFKIDIDKNLYNLCNIRATKLITHNHEDSIVASVHFKIKRKLFSKEAADEMKFNYFDIPNKLVQKTEERRKMTNEEFTQVLMEYCKAHYPDMPEDIVTDCDMNLIARWNSMYSKDQPEDQIFLSKCAKYLNDNYMAAKLAITESVKTFLMSDNLNDIIINRDEIVSKYVDALMSVHAANSPELKLYEQLLCAKQAVAALSRYNPDIQIKFGQEFGAVTKYIIRLVHKSTQLNDFNNDKLCIAEATIRFSFGQYHTSFIISSKQLGPDSYDAYKELHECATKIIKVMKDVETNCRVDPIKEFYNNTTSWRCGK